MDRLILLCIYGCRTYEESNIFRAESIVVSPPIRGLLSPPPPAPAVYRSSLSRSVSPSSSFSVLPIMVESTMTVDYCPRWKAPGDRVQVHRKTRSTEVSRDFPQGPRIILCRRSFWNSTVFLRTSKQSRTSNADVVDSHKFRLEIKFARVH